MILQREIREKAESWEVPPSTVDKDYVLGHFLSVFIDYYRYALIFKGGTCLRKCYIDDYRFFEDLDFTSRENTFKLKQKDLSNIAGIVTANTGIQLAVGKIKPVLSQNNPKGFQVHIKYWGADHSKNKRPLPPKRWLTKIKLEISTDETIVLPVGKMAIKHPYSDELTGAEHCNCYCLDEIVAEKLRALKQRSYTAPRDFYDLYHLTQDFSQEKWTFLFPVFLQKMKHKNLDYHSLEDLITDSTLKTVKRAWKTSIAHQVKKDHRLESNEIIKTVVERLKKYLSNGQ